MKKVRISELPESKDLKGLYTVGTDANNNSVKVPLESTLQGIETAIDDALSKKADLVNGKVPDMQLSPQIIYVDSSGEMSQSMHTVSTPLNKLWVNTNNGSIYRAVELSDGNTITAEELFSSVFGGVISSIVGGTAPSNWSKGKMYLNTTDGIFYIYDPTTAGGVWKKTSDAIYSTLFGKANGIATLDGDGKVPEKQLPEMVKTVNGVEPDEAGNVAITVSSQAKEITTADEFAAIGNDAENSTCVVSSPLTISDDLDFTGTSGRHVYIHVKNTTLTLANLNVGTNNWHFVGEGNATVNFTTIQSANPSIITGYGVTLVGNTANMYVLDISNCHNCILTGGCVSILKTVDCHGLICKSTAVDAAGKPTTYMNGAVEMYNTRLLEYNLYARSTTWDYVRYDVNAVAGDNGDYPLITPYSAVWDVSKFSFKCKMYLYTSPFGIAGSFKAYNMDGAGIDLTQLGSGYAVVSLDNISISNVSIISTYTKALLNLHVHNCAFIYSTSLLKLQIRQLVGFTFNSCLVLSANPIISLNESYTALVVEPVSITNSAFLSLFTPNSNAKSTQVSIMDCAYESDVFTVPTGIAKLNIIRCSNFKTIAVHPKLDIKIQDTPGVTFSGTAGSIKIDKGWDETYYQSVNPINNGDYYVTSSGVEWRVVNGEWTN